MNTKKEISIDSLMIASGKYSVSISQRKGNYVVHLEKIDATHKVETPIAEKKSVGRPHKLQIVRDEVLPLRGRGRPRKETSIIAPEKKHVGRPRKLEIVRDEVVTPKKRGRPPKMSAAVEAVKRGRGRPKKAV